MLNRAVLRIDKLTYRVGARLLFDQADAAVNPGHRVGLVGRNGTGKTMLLRLISGELEPDGGRIEKPARWRLGITRQEAPDGPVSLIETVLSADREMTTLAEEVETADDPHRIGDPCAAAR
jgi:ATP-binding cassette subfamily F protein 3